MRFSEAERLAGRNICFNRPFEASKIEQARKIVNGLNTSPKDPDQSEAPKPAEAPKPKASADSLFGSLSSGRGRERSGGRSRRYCW